MALITFISDFGDSDYYAPAVKAKILSVNPQLNIIDISHKIKTHDVAHAAFILKAVYKDFPKGTVHLVALNNENNMKDGYIGIKLEEHIFIGPNNGVLSLLADYDPGIVVLFADIHLKDSSFPTKDILAPIAAKVASGAAIHDFGSPLTQIKKLISRQFKATRKQIVGHVVHVDTYGNLITNIRKDVFDKLNPGKFSVVFNREELTKINKSYNNVEQGDCFVIFNSLDLLEIGINNGHGSNLLGLRLDSPIIINFDAADQNA